MLDTLNNVIERQALLSHHVPLLFAASITSVVPLPGRDVPSSWHVKLTVSRSGESSVFTSVSTFSVYSCETSQREDRRVGSMTIASSVAEWVASGTLDPGASPRISLRVSAGSLSFRQRSLIFLSFSLSLKRWLRALPRALSWACTSLDMVSLEFARCNFFCRQAYEGLQLYEHWWAALNLRARSAPVSDRPPPPRKNFLGIHLPAKSK